MALRVFVLSLVCFLPFQFQAQHRLADSLRSRLLRQSDPDTTRIILLNQLAYELRDDSAAHAYKYAQEARAISENVHYTKGKAEAYALIGLSLWSQANYSLALKNLLEGLALADSLQYAQAQADILSYLGLVHGSIGGLNKALQYQLQAHALQHKLKNTKQEIRTLNSIGDCYLRLKLYPKSFIYYKKALELGTPLKYGLASNYRNIGNVYEAEGELEQALSNYLIAKKISDSTNDLRNKSQIRKSLGSVYFKQKKYELAETALREGFALSLQGNFRSITYELSELLARVKEAQGNLTESIYFYQLYDQYNDSIRQGVEPSKIASLQIEYESQRHELEIARLKKDSEIQHEELKQKNVLLGTTAIVILLIILFLIYSIRSYKFQKKFNQKLAQHNTEIDGQQSELAEQRDEVITLNEEIRAQQEEVVQQRDALFEKNKNIEQLYKSLTQVNLQLEVLVARRTAALEEQNKRLSEYTHITANKLVEPTFHILNLVELIRTHKTANVDSALTEKLKLSSAELDLIIRSISDTLQQGLNAYENKI
ncbi:MAG: tetratricopeptide repeat protein [Bacteroidetes bacterium]|nr:tetratricopeptide repeat protein [Bacteroidota bacterium]